MILARRNQPDLTPSKLMKLFESNKIRSRLNELERGARLAQKEIDELKVLERDVSLSSLEDETINNLKN